MENGSKRPGCGRIAAGLAAVFLAGQPASGQDQDFMWSRRVGGQYAEAGTSLALDSQGNVILTGGFRGVVDFDPGPGVEELVGISPTVADMFVLKLDRSGSFGWAKRLGGGGQDTPASIAVDAAGNVFTTGSFQQSADFDPSPSAIHNLTAVGGWDVFISKLDSQGNFVWAKQLGGHVTESASSIAVGPSGSVYTTGVFNGTVDFDPDLTATYDVWGGTEGDLFLSKLDTDGAFVWAKRIGGDFYDIGLAVAVDGTESVYLTGYYSGSVDFDPGPGVHTLTAPINLAQVFVVKLDLAGNFVWARSLGGDQTVDLGVALAVDGAGHVHVTGYFRGTADFDPNASATYELTSAGEHDIFVLKLDAEGQFLWARRMGGTQTDTGQSIAVDGLGNVYTTGSFISWVDFDPGPGVYELRARSGDGFVSKLDRNGQFVWAKSVGGTTGDGSNEIRLDPDGSIYTTGGFTGTADFVSGAGSYDLQSAGEADVYVLKLVQTPVVRLEDADTLSWPPLFGEVAYSVYRSELAPPHAFQCLITDSPEPSATDLDEPSVGSGYAYLVTTRNAAGLEGTLGLAAAGGTPTSERPNLNPCP